MNMKRKDECEKTECRSPYFGILKYYFVLTINKTIIDWTKFYRS